MDPNTEKNGGAKAGGKENASDAPAAPPAPHEPAPSEIVKVVGDIVSKIERWAPGAQSRVLQSVAAALGVAKSPNAGAGTGGTAGASRTNQNQSRGERR